MLMNRWTTAREAWAGSQYGICLEYISLNWRTQFHVAPLPRPPCYFGSGFCSKIAPDYYYLLAASFEPQTPPSRLSMR
jgi:hypothetical protein